MLNLQVVKPISQRTITLAKEAMYDIMFYNNHTLGKILFPGNEFHLTLDDVIEM